MSTLRLALVATLVIACSGSDKSGTVPVATTPGTGGSSGPGGTPAIPGTSTGGAVGSATGGAPGGSETMADGGGAKDGPASASDGGSSSSSPDGAGAPAPGSDGGGGVASDGGVLVCWADPKVIMICHQLENACENCPPGGAPPKNKTAQDCFDLVDKAYKGMATDADCAKFATDHMCTVDNATTTGNVCGTLNCYAPGCKDKARCLDRQQWGDSSMCAQFVATCPCQ
jgi:hypothetical protein